MRSPQRIPRRGPRTPPAIRLKAEQKRRPNSVLYLSLGSSPDPTKTPQSPQSGAWRACGVTGECNDHSTRPFRRNARWLATAFAHPVRKRFAATAPVSKRRCRSAERYPTRAQRGGLDKSDSEMGAVPSGAALSFCARQSFDAFNCIKTAADPRLAASDAIGPGRQCPEARRASRHAGCLNEAIPNRDLTARLRLCRS
jgi:hypothetical protein